MLFSLQDCQCFGLPQVILRDLWLTWNKAPRGADPVQKKKKKMLLGSFRRTKHWRQSCPGTGMSTRCSAFWFLPRAPQLKNLTSLFSVVNGGYGKLLASLSFQPVFSSLQPVGINRAAMAYTRVHEERRDPRLHPRRHQFSERGLTFSLNPFRFHLVAEAFAVRLLREAVRAPNSSRALRLLRFESRGWCSSELFPPARWKPVWKRKAL